MVSEWRERWVDATNRAAAAVGGLRALERAAGLPRSSIIMGRWKRAKPPAIEVVIAVSRASGGVVKIADVFPHVVEAVKEEIAAPRPRRRSRKAAAQ